MGMFDYVKVEVELPDGKDNTVEFQTKCTPCNMQTVTITKDGFLAVTKIAYEDEYMEKHLVGDPDYLAILVAVDSMYFYNYEGDRKYIAYFDTGKLKYIKVAE